MVMLTTSGILLAKSDTLNVALRRLAVLMMSPGNCDNLHIFCVIVLVTRYDEGCDKGTAIARRTVATLQDAQFPIPMKASPYTVHGVQIRK